MRYFSSSSASLFTTRRYGFYLSVRVAKQVADRVAYVLECSDVQRNVLERILRDGISEGRLALGRFTTSEERVIRDLLAWWSVDTVEDFQKKAFIVANLNVGRSLVITAHATKTLLIGEDGQPKWTTATEESVRADIEANDLLAKQIGMSS